MEHTDHILSRVYRLMQAYSDGLLGGEKLPEDENPLLDRASMENYTYFTLPMALNYQRNSYTLWECANRMYNDESARRMFDTQFVCNADEQMLREQLVRHKVALQPNKQPVIWRTLCQTIENQLDGDIRNLFINNEYSVERIKDHINRNKSSFPYLGGTKICNYWLYVIEQYTDARFTDRQNITVAPDTHIIQSSVELGVITKEESICSSAQTITADRWKALLRDTQWVPIDLHTPMWLWSRSKFAVKI